MGKDELGVHGRLEGHGRHEERGVAPEHGEVVAAPCAQLGVVAAPLDELAEHVGEGASLRKLLLGDAGDGADVLVELLIDAGLDDGAEGIGDAEIRIHAARADFDDFMGHTVIGGIAALVPLEVKDDQVAGLRGG